MGLALCYLEAMVERPSGDPDPAPIYTINSDLLQIIAQDAIGRDLSQPELEEIARSIYATMYDHLIDCILACLQNHNALQILENDHLRGHQLLPEEERTKLPPLYANEKQGSNASAQVKFFLPGSYWTWYASEFDGQDTLFGLVVGHHIELGYFSYRELAGIRGGNGQVIERDLYFEPQALDELRAKHEADRME